MISGESLAAQGGALAANLTVGALAAAQGTGTAWLVAGALLALTGVLVAAPLRRALDPAARRWPPAARTATERAEN